MMIEKNEKMKKENFRSLFEFMWDLHRTLTRESFHTEDFQIFLLHHQIPLAFFTVLFKTFYIAWFPIFEGTIVVINLLVQNHTKLGFLKNIQGAFLQLKFFLVIATMSYITNVFLGFEGLAYPLQTRGRCFKLVWIEKYKVTKQLFNNTASFNSFNAGHTNGINSVSVGGFIKKATQKNIRSKC
jgi:hypothetical protein